MQSWWWQTWGGLLKISANFGEQYVKSFGSCLRRHFHVRRWRSDIRCWKRRPRNIYIIYSAIDSLYKLAYLARDLWRPISKRGCGTQSRLTLRRDLRANCANRPWVSRILAIILISNSVSIRSCFVMTITSFVWISIDYFRYRGLEILKLIFAKDN